MHKKKRWCVYVAGKYSDDNVLDVLKNMRKGIKKSAKLFELGYAPFCPWIDYHYVLSSDAPDAITVQDFYDYSIEWLKKSDAVLVLQDWEDSHGTVKEVEMARSLGIPIFLSVSAMSSFFDIKEAKMPEAS